MEENMLKAFFKEIGKYIDLKECAIVVYGSNIYKGIKSDLDFCIICENETSMNIDIIIEIVKKFHVKYGLMLDEEVPYTNKLLYSKSEVISLTEDKFPFKDKYGNYHIADTNKDHQFLSSEDMHYRLLLNILTTDKRIYSENEELIDFIQNYSFKAKSLLYTAIINYFKVSTNDLASILQLFYQNPKSGKFGEDYLGYKKGNMQKELYLKNWIQYCIDNSSERIV